jgi:ABC-type lipoprotein release transport system permease subunit
VIFLAQMALRNLARNLGRTAITSITIVFGVALPILGWGMIDGIDENMLRASRQVTVGDVLLRPDAYPLDGIDFPLSDAAVPSPALAAKLDAAGTWTSRAVFPARLVKGAESTRANGYAYDAAHDPEVFPRDTWTIDGSWPKAGPTPGVVLGRRLARLIDVKVGEAIVVEARTFPGALNALSFEVVGIVDTDNSAVDALGFWVDLAVAEEFLALGGARTHIALRSGDPDATAAALVGQGWSTRTLAAECADLIEMNMIRRYALLFLVGIIFLIAGAGIANTVIMAAYERVREIGTLVALGMKKRDVSSLFLLEGAAMGFVAGTLGAMLGTLGVLYFQKNGIALGGVTESAGNLSMASTLFTQFRLPPILIAWSFGLAISTLASIWPARFAANLNPADAVKAD